MTSKKTDLRPPFSYQDVKLETQQTAYEGFYQLQKVQLQHKLYQGGWGKSIARECIIRPHAVSVLAYDPHLDQVVLVEQFRIGAYLAPPAHVQGDSSNEASPWLIECVAGLLDTQCEDPAQTARRELLEEAGLKAKHMRPIFSLYCSPGGSNERSTLFYAEVDASKAGGIHGVVDEGENIKVLTLDFKDAILGMEHGRIDNAQCVTALLWLQVNRSKLRQEAGITT